MSEIDLVEAITAKKDAEIGRLQQELTEATEQAKIDQAGLGRLTEIGSKWERRTKEAQCERDEARAKRAEMGIVLRGIIGIVTDKDSPWWMDCPEKGGVDVEAIEAVLKDNPGAPFLDRLRRAEALI